MAKPKKYEKTLYIRITKELKDKIEIAANKENVDPTDLVRKILETNKNNFNISAQHVSFSYLLFF